MLIIEKELNEAIGYFNADLRVDTSTYIDNFIKLGIEVESVTPLWNNKGPIVVGEVVSFTELTDFKKPIRLCLVEVGLAKPVEIICGATNFQPKDKVIVALPGAELVNDFKIAVRHTYGHDSNGMLCAARELGFPVDSPGIMVVNFLEAAPGTPAAEALDLAGNIFDLTFTPDRGYLLSYRGLLRDLSLVLPYEFSDTAFFNFLSQKYHLPTEKDMKSTLVHHQLTVDSDSVATLQTYLLEEVDNQTTTPWSIASTLIFSGFTLTNLAIDLANYAMVELGAPLHVYDLAKVSGDLTVTNLATESDFISLAGDTLALKKHDLVIKDSKSIVTLAGIIGGETCKVTPETKRILIEAGSFNAAQISRTARRLNLVTEASKRFERGVDSCIVAKTLKLASDLLTKFSQAKLVSNSVYQTALPTTEIIYDFGLLERVTSLTADSETQLNILGKLGITTTTKTDSDTTLQIPSWRPDLVAPIDIVEELVRVLGYTQIIPVVPTRKYDLNFKGSLPILRFEIEKLLAAKGFTQVLTNPFMSSVDLDKLNLTSQDFRRRVVTIANPLDKEVANFASTLIPSLLRIVKKNIDRGNKSLAVFSVAKVATASSAANAPIKVKVAEHIDEAKRNLIEASIPSQHNSLVMLVTGYKSTKNPYNQESVFDVFDLLDVLPIFEQLTNCDIRVENLALAPMHPGRSAVIKVAAETIGQVGQLHPQVSKQWRIPEATFLLELNLDKLTKQPLTTSPIISEYPPVLQDLSITLPKEVSAGEVIKLLQDNTDNLLAGIELYDMYDKPPIPEGSKSLTFALSFQSPEKTLTEEEATQVKNKALAVLEEKVGAEIRGKGSF